MDTEHIKQLENKYSYINNVKYNKRVGSSQSTHVSNDKSNVQYGKKKFQNFSNKKPNIINNVSKNKSIRPNKNKAQQNQKNLSESSDSDLENPHDDFPLFKLGLETEEEIQAWREERKKNFPSDKNIQFLSLFHKMYPEIKELQKSSNKEHSNKQNVKNTKKGRCGDKNFKNQGKQYTILESVLKDQINEERVWLLQAIRYIVKNDFFDD